MNGGFPGQRAPARSGQFTRHFLDGLRQRAADADSNGLVTAQEAVSYVRHKLDESFNAARQVLADRQEPLADISRADLPLFALP